MSKTATTTQTAPTTTMTTATAGTYVAATSTSTDAHTPCSSGVLAGFHQPTRTYIIYNPSTSLATFTGGLATSGAVECGLRCVARGAACAAFTLRIDGAPARCLLWRERPSREAKVPNQRWQLYERFDGAGGCQSSAASPATTTKPTTPGAKSTTTTTTTTTTTATATTTTTTTTTTITPTFTPTPTSTIAQTKASTTSTALDPYTRLVARMTAAANALVQGTRGEPFNSTPMAVNPISSGSPHVRPMGVHRTCGEPDEFESRKIPTRNILPLFFVITVGLTQQQRAAAMFDYDSTERSRANMQPLQYAPKNGLRLNCGDAGGGARTKGNVARLIATGLSAGGVLRATTINQAEAAAIGQSWGDQDDYVVSVFGDPRDGVCSRWGWRCVSRSRKKSVNVNFFSVGIFLIPLTSPHVRPMEAHVWGAKRNRIGRHRGGIERWGWRYVQSVAGYRVARWLPAWVLHVAQGLLLVITFHGSFRPGVNV